MRPRKLEKPLTSGEIRRIQEAAANGVNIHAMIKQFHRGRRTLETALAMKPANLGEPTNKDKIVRANEALTASAPHPTTSNIEHVIEALHTWIKGHAPEIRSFNMDLASGVVEVVVEAKRKFQIG